MEILGGACASFERGEFGSRCCSRRLLSLLDGVAQLPCLDLHHAAEAFERLGAYHVDLVVGEASHCAEGLVAVVNAGNGVGNYTPPIDPLAPRVNGSGAVGGVDEFVVIDAAIAIGVECQADFVEGLAVGGAHLELVKGLGE